MNINLTILGQAIAMAIFVWFCMKYVWPPLMNIMHERQKRIADGLAEAERGHREKELAEEHATKLIKEAKAEAAEILAAAQKQGNLLVEEAKSTAGTERDRIIESGHAEVLQEVNRAKQQLREEVAGVALAGAERILQREVDANTHKDVLDELVTQI